jgi:hypothetical protein
MHTPESPPVEIVPISRLFCSPTNPRRNDAAVPHVAASIRRFGWQQPIVARRSGEVIAGNTRLKAAQSLGMSEVPVCSELAPPLSGWRAIVLRGPSVRCCDGSGRSGSYRRRNSLPGREPASRTCRFWRRGGERRAWSRSACWPAASA